MRKIDEIQIEIKLLEYNFKDLKVYLNDIVDIHVNLSEHNLINFNDVISKIEVFNQAFQGSLNLNFSE